MPDTQVCGSAALPENLSVTVIIEIDVDGDCVGCGVDTNQPR